MDETDCVASPHHVNPNKNNKIAKEVSLQAAKKYNI